MIAIACQAIDTGPYQEMRSNLLGGAKQFINIGLTITDMDALRWLLESSVDCLRFSSHRMLSLVSMGIRVRLTSRLSAATPLNFFLVQNFTALSPSGSPSRVTARLECINIPQVVYVWGFPSNLRELLLGMRLIIPIRSGRSL
ncbi:hypothetical protein CQ14_37680 [Bradyrhizobium lablabi]|uniref:Uncharacterized protein n=1 Tax=Bradyrhizobium lablabi TaxID=722472 RepID=A0A0R3MKJ2_9BRAD|nr:hypothetical protein CQ14_37680 [Bradyrhizobium lablabi]